MNCRMPGSTKKQRPMNRIPSFRINQSLFTVVPSTCPSRPHSEWNGVHRIEASKAVGQDSSVLHAEPEHIDADHFGNDDM